MRQLELGDAACNAFWVALLLSADSDIAQEVVQAVIQSLDPDDLSTDALMICVTTLALQQGSDEADAQTVLPEELRNVMKLPRMPRQCFVLRILLGLSQARCAELLRVDRTQISSALARAASELAAMTAVAQFC